MTETLLKYFEKLKKEKLHSSQSPKALLENNDFQNMLRNDIILNKIVGRGTVYELNEEKRIVYESWFAKNFPNSTIEVTDKASSIAKFKDSKAKYAKKSSIIFLKGNKTITLNNEIIDLQTYTLKFGLFACLLESLETDKICFVENKESFLNVEKIIGNDYIFIHSYGRIGTNLLQKIKANEILVFSDYDYVGLNEYLKCKAIFENTNFFIPENYDLLFSKYAKEINLKRKKGQKASNKVLKSDDKVVLRICKDLQSTQKFLEQESLLIAI